MNELSIALYLTNVLANIGFFAGILVFAGIIGLVFTTGLGFHLISYKYFIRARDPNHYDYLVAKGEVSAFYTCLKSFLTLTAISLLLAVSIPSSKTMYMIIASEISEEALELPEVQRIRNIINQKLNEYEGVETQQ